MPQIPVRQDDREYQRLLMSNGPNREKQLTDNELRLVPAGAYILTGVKTANFGGGMSPDGFVMNGKVLLGRIRIAGRVRDGRVIV